MIISNEKQFAKLNADGSRALENAHVFIMSHTLTVESETSNVLSGNASLASLTPPKDLLDSFVNGDIGKKQFKKEYKKHLKADDNQFFIYSIGRSVNEQHALPIFVCSDAEWETGYLKIFAELLSKKFGLKLLKTKEYLKEVASTWKETKRGGVKKKKRLKAFKSAMKSLAKENTQLSLDGIKTLEKLDKKFAIDRIMIYASNNNFDDVSRKKLTRAIEDFEQYNKKSKKLVEAARKEAGVSKKRDRWTRQEAISVIVIVYNNMYGDENRAD